MIEDAIALKLGNIAGLDIMDVDHSDIAVTKTTVPRKPTIADSPVVGGENPFDDDDDDFVVPF